MSDVLLSAPKALGLGLTLAKALTGIMVTLLREGRYTAYSKLLADVIVAMKNAEKIPEELR